MTDHTEFDGPDGRDPVPVDARTDPHAGIRPDAIRPNASPQGKDRAEAAEAPAGAPVRARRAPLGAPEDTAPVDPAIKAELVSHMRVLRAFAISLTRNGARADDLVQETVMKAWANIHSYEPGTNMRAWLFTILRNSFYSERRKAKREVADEEGEMAEQVATKPDHDGRLNYADFRRAFEQLPVEQREVLVLVGAMQHSYEDAAEMCGVRIGTIKSRLNRGRARLAELMQIDEADTLELTDSATSAVVSAGRTTL
jgi:RNA polymerase sigma-70 factor (ECF subfamily)